VKNLNWAKLKRLVGVGLGILTLSLGSVGLTSCDYEREEAPLEQEEDD
jgi:hypothetical protein